MADIEVTCTQCNTTLKVSEYVDIEAVTCRACGGKMSKPAGVGTVTKAPSVRLAASKPAATTESTVPEPSPESLERMRKIRSFFPKRLTRKAKSTSRRSKGPTSTIRYWILFALLLPVTAWLRWGDVLEASDLDLVILGSLIFFGVLHVSLVAQAFHDDVFQGVLCIFIPFYSVYYLLTQSDALSLRALGAAMLLAFGWDLSQFLVDTSLAIYDFVQKWIFAGGSL